MMLQFDSGFINGFHNRFPLEGISYNSIFAIVGLYNKPVQILIDALGLAEVFIPLDLMSATKTQSSPASSSFPGITFKSNRGYHLRIFHERKEQFRIEYMQIEPSALAYNIVNLFLPDLRGYVHGFNY